MEIPLESHVEMGIPIPMHTFSADPGGMAKEPGFPSCNKMSRKFKDSDCLTLHHFAAPHFLCGDMICPFPKIGKLECTKGKFVLFFNPLSACVVLPFLSLNYC